LITEGPTAAAPALDRALALFSSDDVPEQDALRWLWLACPVAQLFRDGETTDRLSARQIQLARDAGALGVLPVALLQRAGLLLQHGDFMASALCIEEASSVSVATGSHLPQYAPLGPVAFRGRAREAAVFIDAARDQPGGAPAFVHWATAVLDNSLGHYEDAMAEARLAMVDDDELVFSTWAASELVEAATRIGKPGEATVALDRITRIAQASGTHSALGVEACARALLGDDELSYCTALDHLGRTRDQMPLARAHLVYGEWLRRRRRRADARAQLRTAHEMFSTMGADGFASRAAHEILATGETIRKRAAQSMNSLTPQEDQIARLARDGLTNPEIGAQLFISAHTVQYHLRKVFGKLEVRSRRQLAQALDPLD
jgi:DNA-binding CsgD family transcriptional regulator